MANVKITELTALTDPASTDVLPIVDVVADVTKKISIADLLENAGSGTAAAPGIAFDGDSNTGIYRPGADQLAFATNGTQALYIDSDGDILVADGNRMEIDEVRARDGDGLKLFDDAGAGIFVQDGGNVGIGTSSPASILHASQDVSSGNYQSRITLENTDQRTVIGSYWRSGIGQYSVIQATNEAETTPNTLVLNPSGGNVGIGTTSPNVAAGGGLHIDNTTSPRIHLTNSTTGSTTGDGAELHVTNSDLWIENKETANIILYNAGNEAARIDSSGRLLVGTSTYSGTGTGFEIEGTGNFGPQIRATAKGSDEYPVYQILRKSRGASIVQNGDFIFEIQAQGYDGSSYLPAATIRAEVDGTPGANDMPGRLVFFTTADGASFPTEHFRIASNGDLTATDTTIGSNSDSRLKTNIADFAYDLEVFKQYQPKTFDWKNPKLHGNKTSQRGFIAQDVEAIDDYWVGQQAVDEDSADAEFLDADRLAKTLKLGKKDAMYVSVIQQLLAKVETLETKVAALEAS